MLPTRASLATYGLPKINKRPIRDPRKEADAGQFNAMGADVAAMGLVGHRAVVSVNSAGVIVWHATQWGDADSLKPVVNPTGTGVYTVTYPTSIVDLLGNSQAFAVRDATPFVRNQTTAARAVSDITANVITVRTFNSANTATNLPFLMMVW